MTEDEPDKSPIDVIWDFIEQNSDCTYDQVLRRFMREIFELPLGDLAMIISYCNATDPPPVSECRDFDWQGDDDV